MDYLGGNGNGSAWYAAPAADITTHPLYLKYSKGVVASYDPADIKTEIGGMIASAESAPILNYLNWVLTIRVALG